MNHEIVDPKPTAEDAAHEQHHGDLRKGAYLKRRAEYQMQASTSGTAQAGTLSPRGRATDPKRSRG